VIVAALLYKESTVRKWCWIGLVLGVCGSHLGLATAATGSRQAVPPHGVVVLWGGGDAPPVRLVERFTAIAGKDSHAGDAAALVVGRGPGRSASTVPARAAGGVSTIMPVPATEPTLADRLGAVPTAWVNLPDVPSDTLVLDRLLVDARFLDPTPPPGLVARLAADPGVIGVGVGPDAALVVDGRTLESAGRGPVAICLPASVTQPGRRPLRVDRLVPGERADLVALSRAAIARLGPQFPPEHPATPDVPTGTLFPCGGGNLPDAVWGRFIELAGGPGSPIVVLSIGSPTPDDPAPKGLDVLKRLGCRDVTVLAQRARADVESPTFANALRRARGVWFVGGRQWRYVDAYEGTQAPRLFADVLARGGVVGGSSAGAAIESEYMVRGNPLGNRQISAEGYERGLGLLSGTAIDIHVAQRGRLSDLTGLVHAWPQLLGLALDEQTACEVHGHVLTVLGDGRLNIVDGLADTTVTLGAGRRYDLRTRQTVN
jgi:cyanophycinase